MPIEVLSDDQLTETDEEILDLLREGRVTAPYAAEELDASQEYVRSRLRRFVDHDHAQKVYAGLYELVEDPRDDQSLAEEPTEPEPTPTPSSDETTPAAGAEVEEVSRPQADVELPEEISDEVWHVVDEVTASWDDDADRLEHRRQAAATVLQHAVETGDGVGKSHPIVDAVQGIYPVEGQNAETYWRKNIRDVLKEVGEYSRGKHAYTVTGLDEDDGGPYDPTDEFE